MMVKPGVLMHRCLPDLQALLEPKYRVFPLWEQSDKEAYLAENADSIRGLIPSAMWVDAALIDKLPKLEIVSKTGVGVDRVDLHKCKERGIAVTNTPGVVTDDCADMAIGLLLATMRHICAADRFVRKGLWPKLGNYPTFTHKMSGKHLGIVGLGRIGLAVAKRAEAFGCKISYLARAEKSGPPYKFYATVLELAKNSDMLVLTCALTKETTHLVGREVLDALGPEGFLVNVARGAVVDEQELVKALVEERIAGAGLDVFENEPQVPQELWNMENVVLLPHMAYNTRNTVKGILELVVSNLDAHFSGKPLLTPYVDD